MDINYTADQPVFLNESNKDDRVVLHRYGCTPSGQDPVHHVSLNHGVGHSILPALSLSGVRVMEGSIDSAEAALLSPSDLGSLSVLLSLFSSSNPSLSSSSKHMRLVDGVYKII